MVLWLLIGGLAIALFVIRLARKPFPHRGVFPDRIRRLLEALLKRGYDTAVLRLEVHVPLRVRLNLRIRPFIQFRKYIRGHGDCGLEFGFPNAPWSRDAFSKMRDVVKEEGLDSWVQPAIGDTTEFLLVDLGKDVAKADRLARASLARVFEASPTRQVTGYLIGISPRDEVIC